MADEKDIQEHGDVLAECIEKYAQRDANYQGLWKEQGWEDQLFHIQHKAQRLRVFPNEDDAQDLINYTAFFIRNYRAGRRGVSSGPTAQAAPDPPAASG